MATTTELYVYAMALGSISGSDDQSLPSINLRIEFRVDQTYHSSDGTRKRRDLIGEISSQYPCQSLTFDIISRMIARVNTPFPLEKLQWKGTCDRKPQAELGNVDDLISHVLDEARSTVNRCSKYGRKILILTVSIEKRVILPNHEIEAMDRAKEMEKRVLELHQYVSWMIQVNPGMNLNAIEREIGLRVRNTEPEKGFLNKNYERNLELSLLERAMREYLGGHRSVPASRSSINALETFRFEGDIDVTEEEEVCAICKDDIFIGSRITRMPCSHMYHEVCIAEWLRRSHMCPLCRFMLPTT